MVHVQITEIHEKIRIFNTCRGIRELKFDYPDYVVRRRNKKWAKIVNGMDLT